MKVKLYMIMLLTISFLIEMMLTNTNTLVKPLFTINIIYIFYEVNKNYMKSLYVYKMESLVFNEYNTIFLIFLFINSLFSTENYIFVFIFILMVFVLIIKLNYTRSSNVFLYTSLIIFFLIYFITNDITNIFYLNNYYFKMSPSEISMLILNIFINVILNIILYAFLKNKINIRR